MGVWIRKKNKKELVEVCAIERDEDNLCEIVGTSITQDFYTLGKYSQTWKVVKVLTMIEDHINDRRYNFSDNVFKMPADEEVH